MATPTIWNTMNSGTDSQAMPEKALVSVRPIVTAGLANDVEDVKK